MPKPKTPPQKELSTEANIGKILILVGVILQALGALSLFVLGPLWMGGMMGFGGMMGWMTAMMGAQGVAVFGSIALLVGLVQIAGVVVGIYAFKAAQEGNFRSAGYLAIIASVLPPLQLIALAGGILCLISREGKR